MKEKSLKKNFIISIIRTLIMMVVPLVIFPYASRILGKEGVGRVQYIQSIASYFQLFAISGIASYGIREGTRYREDKRKLGKFISEMLIINFTTTAIATIVFLMLFLSEGLKSYHSIMFIFVFYVIFNGMALDWYFNIVEEYGYITVRSGILYGIAVAILLLFMRDRRDVEVYAVVTVFPYVGTFFMNYRYMSKELPLFKIHSEGKEKRERYEIKKHLRPIMLVFSIIISANIFYLLDTTMFGVLRGDAYVGSYTAASKLTRLVAQMIAAICAVFLPRLSYYVGKKETSKFRSLAVDSANMILWIAVPCAIGLIALAPEAIIIFSGREFLDAVSALQILAVNLLFSSLNSFLGWHVLVPNHKEYILLSATLAGAVLDFVLNLILIMKMGLPGAAIATLISEGTVFLICLIFSRNYLEWKKVFIHGFKCLIAALPILGIGAAVGQITQQAIIKSFVTVGVSVITYAVLLLLLKDDIMLRMMKAVKRLLWDKMTDKINKK